MWSARPRWAQRLLVGVAVWALLSSLAVTASTATGTGGVGAASAHAPGEAPLNPVAADRPGPAAVPEAASETLTLMPASGPAGTTVNVTASGFLASDTSISVLGPTSMMLCSIPSAGSGGGVCSFSASSAGGLSFTLGGTLNVISAIGETGGDFTTANFTGTVAQFDIASPLSGGGVAEGPVGTTIALTGNGLAPSTPYQPWFEASNPTQIGSPPSPPAYPLVLTCTNGVSDGEYLTTSASGGFVCTAVVPQGLSTGGPAWYLGLFLYGPPFAFSTAVTAPSSGTFTVTVPLLTLVPGSALEGPSGTSIEVDATGLAPLVSYTLEFSVTSGASGVASAGLPLALPCAAGAQLGGTLVTDPTGEVDCSIVVPPSLSAGTPYYVSAVEQTSGLVVGSTMTPVFLVTPATLVLTPSAGPLGTVLNLSGTGYALVPGTGYPYYFCFAPTATPTSCTLGAGTFLSTPLGTPVPGSIPSATTWVYDHAGYPWIVVFDQMTNVVVAATEFGATTASITLTPAEGPIGSSVNISGTGFATSASGYTYDYCFATAPATGCGTGSPSTFESTTGAVPAGVSASWTVFDYIGDYDTLTVWDPSTLTVVASATFTETTPEVVATPAWGGEGAPVTISGTGFSLGGTVMIGLGLLFPIPAYTGCSVGTETGSTITATASGSFQCSFAVPGGVGPDPVQLFATDLLTGDGVPGTFTALFPLTFSETGFSGVTWSVTVQGPAGGNFSGSATASGTSSSLVVWVPTGTFTYRIANVSGWYITTPATNGSAGTLTVGGAGSGANVTFSPAPKTSPAFLGLPATEGYAVLGLAVAAAAVAAGVLVYRRRSGKGPNSAPREAPPTTPGTP
jgi:hypothetical protein